MRGNFLSVSISVLPPSGLGRKDRIVYINPAVANDVFLAHIGNHPLDFASTAAPGQVPAVHDGIGGLVGSDHHHHPQRALPETQHAQDGALGALFLHQTSS